MIKDGAKMINAVTNSKVPHITINLGGVVRCRQLRHVRPCPTTRGCSFTWPNSKTAIMGPRATRGRACPSSPARPPSPPAARSTRRPTPSSERKLEEQIEAESLALYMSGQCYDDGVIDPRDTRDVLGMALSHVPQQRSDRDPRVRVFRM